MFYENAGFAGLDGSKKTLYSQAIYCILILIIIIINRGFIGMNATDLANGTSAIVRQLNGHRSFLAKMESMGIFPGAIIVKKSHSLMRGPVVIEKGTTQLALGYRLAKNIIVEPLPLRPSTTGM